MRGRRRLRRRDVAAIGRRHDPEELRELTRLPRLGRRRRRAGSGGWSGVPGRRWSVPLLAGRCSCERRRGRRSARRRRRLPQRLHAESLHVGPVGATRLGKGALVEPLGEAGEPLQELGHDREARGDRRGLEDASLVLRRQSPEHRAQRRDRVGARGIGEVHHDHAPGHRLQCVVRANAVRDCHALEELVPGLEVRRGHQDVVGRTTPPRRVSQRAGTSGKAAGAARGAELYCSPAAAWMQSSHVVAHEALASRDGSRAPAPRRHHLPGLLRAPGTSQTEPRRMGRGDVSRPASLSGAAPS